MLIYLKNCYTILGKIKLATDKSRFKFTVPSEGTAPVIITIPDEGNIESLHEIEISEDMWQLLQDDEFIRNKLISPSELPKELVAELLLMRSGIEKPTRRILHLIKCCLQQRQIRDQLVSLRDAYWSIDKLNWKMLPIIASVNVDVSSSLILDEDSARVIQNYIDIDFEPFLALSHLRRARNEKDLRQKWIDATIAAELAIKEFLVRFKSDLRSLLLHLQAPPLDKLYKGILKFYTGQVSPKYKELQNGC